MREAASLRVERESTLEARATMGAAYGFEHRGAARVDRAPILALGVEVGWPSSGQARWCEEQRAEALGLDAIDGGEGRKRSARTVDGAHQVERSPLGEALVEHGGGGLVRGEHALKPLVRELVRRDEATREPRHGGQVKPASGREHQTGVLHACRALRAAWGDDDRQRRVGVGSVAQAEVA